MKKNYISIAGVKNYDEMKEIIRIYDRINEPKRKLSFGIFLSQHHFISKENRVIQAKTLINFGKDHPELFTVLHYNVRKSEIFNEENLCSNFIDRYNLYRYIKGIQFNLNPDQYLISSFLNIKKKYPGLKIILQLNLNYFKKMKKENVFNHLISLRDYVDYILVDSSRGKGIPINLDYAIEIYQSLNQYFSIVFAGGLGVNVGEIQEEITNKIGNNFSLDAQSKLLENKKISLTIVEKYLRKGSILLFKDDLCPKCSNRLEKIHSKDSIIKFQCKFCNKEFEKAFIEGSIF